MRRIAADLLAKKQFGMRKTYSSTESTSINQQYALNSFSEKQQ
jgi:hypothetical protein